MQHNLFAKANYFCYRFLILRLSLIQRSIEFLGAILYSFLKFSGIQNHYHMKFKLSNNNFSTYIAYCENADKNFFLNVLLILSHVYNMQYYTNFIYGLVLWLS